MSTLYYVGNPDGQQRRLPGVPPHDLETEQVRALAADQGVATAEMRRSLLASGLYTAKDPADADPPLKQETPAQAESSKPNQPSGTAMTAPPAPAPELPEEGSPGPSERPSRPRVH